jgi:hypothetical protein
MYMSGKFRPKYFPMVSNAFSNVDFTNFLSDETYYALLHSVDAVMCLTAQGIRLWILQLINSTTGTKLASRSYRICIRSSGMKIYTFKNLIERYLSKE